MNLLATVIGDVVSSRHVGDRAGMHRELAALLDRVNADTSPVTPLRFTVGDEFQGAFATIEQALRATLRLRVGLLPTADLRHGIGFGAVRVLQDEPRVEDGPGWWAAREAIDAVHDAEDHPATRWVRTAVRGEGVEAPVAALLPLRDRIVAALDERGSAILAGLLDGRAQREIADDLAISPSAVSQRIRSSGIDALVLSDQALADQAVADGLTE